MVCLPKRSAALAHSNTPVACGNTPNQVAPGDAMTDAEIRRLRLELRDSNIEVVRLKAECRRLGGEDERLERYQAPIDRCGVWTRWYRKAWSWVHAP